MNYLKTRIFIEKDLYNMSKPLYITNKISIALWIIGVLFNIPSIIGTIGFIGYLITLVLTHRKVFKSPLNDSEVK